MILRNDRDMPVLPSGAPKIVNDNPVKDIKNGIGEVVTGVVAGATAMPFLQAMATHFGTRLAGSIDERTRTALRHYLCREEAQSDGSNRVLRLESMGDRGRQQEGSEGRPAIKVTNEWGWIIEISVEAPAEAIAQLLAMKDITPPPFDASHSPILHWIYDSWIIVGLQNGEITLREWADGSWYVFPRR